MPFFPLGDGSEGFCFLVPWAPQLSPAICYLKLAVDVTLTNYNRLKAFVKEQMINFNQNRAENPLVKKVQTPIDETVDPEGREEFVKTVVESLF